MTIKPETDFSQNFAFEPMRFLIACLIALSCWSSSVFADDYPLLVEIEGSSYNSRSGGPIALAMRVQCSLPEPGVAGELSLQLVNQAGVRIGTYVLDGLFFSPGIQDYEFLIQPPTASLWENQYDVFVTFHPAEGGSHRLVDQVLRVPGAQRRSCLITIAADSEGPLPKDLAKLVSEFSLEQALPGSNNQDRSFREVVTLTQRMNAPDFPNSPLEHCASDILMIPDGMYGKLSQQQRQAILAWTRAGGSTMLIFKNEQRLESDEIGAVNELAGFAADSPGIYQTTEGQTYFADRSTDAPLLTDCGLGRTAVFLLGESETLEDKYSEKSITESFIHLWKIRREQIESIVQNGEWSWEPGRRYTAQYNWNFNNPNDPGVEQFIRRFRQSPALGGASLLQQTRPTGMQMFPLWLISLTLILYVAVIGPMDYLLLGSLKLRKLTWVFFPLVTIMFTVGAIFASNRMMQGSNEGGSVTFHDVTDEGLIARENKLQTMLLSSSRQIVLEAQGELITPVDVSKLGASVQYANQPSQDIPTSQPVYYGSFPTGARVVQSVHKWSPQVFRRMRIPAQPEPEPSGFDWTTPIRPSDRNARLELSNRIRAAFGKDAHAQLIRRRPGRGGNTFGQMDLEVVSLTGSAQVFMPTGDQDLDVYQQRGPYATSPAYGYRHNTAEINFLRTTAIREEHGMFSVVSQVSPKCDDYLEDLALLDSSNPDEWMLMIVVKDDNQWDVYRRIYSDP